MQQFQIYVIMIALGLGYFGLVSLLKRWFPNAYKAGFFVLLAIFLFFLGMLLFVSPKDTTGWSGLGYVIMLFLTGIVNITYIIAWLFVSLYQKNKSSS